MEDEVWGGRGCVGDGGWIKRGWYEVQCNRQTRPDQTRRNRTRKKNARREKREREVERRGEERRLCVSTERSGDHRWEERSESNRGTGYDNAVIWGGGGSESGVAVWWGLLVADSFTRSLYDARPVSLDSSTKKRTTHTFNNTPHLFHLSPHQLHPSFTLHSFLSNHNARRKPTPHILPRPKIRPPSPSTQARPVEQQHSDGFRACFALFLG